MIWFVVILLALAAIVLAQASGCSVVQDPRITLVLVVVLVGAAVGWPLFSTVQALVAGRMGV